MWKISDGTYRFQTTDSKVSKELKKIQEMELISFGMNSFNEIYQIKLKDIEVAKKLLIEITGNEIYRSREGFMAKEQIGLKL